MVVHTTIVIVMVVQMVLILSMDVIIVTLLGCAWVAFGTGWFIALTCTILASSVRHNVRGWQRGCKVTLDCYRASSRGAGAMFKVRPGQVADR